MRRDRWDGVNLEIYYQPGHEFNLDTMMQSMKETLAYCTANFSPFQFHQLRIIEFPGYGTFAESFANTIPFSEVDRLHHQSQQEARCGRPSLLRDGARDRTPVVGASGDLGLRRRARLPSTRPWRNTPR